MPDVEIDGVNSTVKVDTITEKTSTSGVTVDGNLLKDTQIETDQIDPKSGTALQIGSSGDTITVPTGATFKSVDKVETDKLDPSSGTALEIGTSGDTITIPTGAGLTVTDEVKTNKISPATGTAFTLGDSGDTFTVPSGATLSNLGTATGFGALAWQAVQTSSPITGAAGKAYPVNTTGGAITLNLPAGSAGDQVGMVDYAGTFDTNALTISADGSEKIQGSTSDVSMDTERQAGGSYLCRFNPRMGDDRGGS